jgi:NAD(P)-dependent dehydrogenase (short-subunit alcohol dehydrogenase family)
MGRLAGRIAIVTGASRGIGEGIARMFSAEGAAVALAARTAERLDVVVSEIRAAGGSALAIPTDVARAEEIRNMVDVTARHFGGLDVLVNNAAVTSFSRRMGDDDMEDEYDRLMATNLKSAWMAIHYALPHMRARGGGSIVNISSVHGVASGGHMSAYAASKGGLIAGTKAMAVELAADLVRVNCISPGRIWLNAPGDWLRRRLGPELYAEFEDRFGDWSDRVRELQQPLPIEGRPEDVAYCATYLASDEARFCTGANYLVDGGMTAVLGDPNMLHPGAAELLRHDEEVRQWVSEALRRAREDDPQHTPPQ